MTISRSNIGQQIIKPNIKKKKKKKTKIKRRK